MRKEIDLTNGLKWIEIAVATALRYSDSPKDEQIILKNNIDKKKKVNLS